MLRPWVTLAAIAAAFGINVWSNITPIAGMTIGEISNRLLMAVLITPANYAFAIWGVIYLGLFAFAIYQALPNQRQDPRFDRIGYLLTLSSAAQILWVLFFLSRLFLLSILPMLVILISLGAAYLQIKAEFRPPSRLQRWCVDWPITVYFAWICVATIVNVAIASSAVMRNCEDIGLPTWVTGMLNPLSNVGVINSPGGAIVSLVVATLIAATVMLRYGDFLFAGVSVWALTAIAVRHLDGVLWSGTSSLRAFTEPKVGYTAGGLAIGLVLLMLFQWHGVSLPNRSSDSG